MDQTFKAGEIVRLRSGGPKMTVINYNVRSEWDELAHASATDEGFVRCQWFAGSKLDEGSFPEVSLEPAEVDKK